MAEVPVIIVGTISRRDKNEEPYPATIAGWMHNADLEVGGGPILPPDEVPPVDPPLTIWPKPGDPDMPLPDPPIPPVDPPPGSTTDHVHPGWNFNDGKNPQYPNVGWYYVYIPGPGDPSPKVA